VLLPRMHLLVMLLLMQLMLMPRRHLLLLLVLLILLLLLLLLRILLLLCVLLLRKVHGTLRSQAAHVAHLRCVQGRQLAVRVSRAKNTKAAAVAVADPPAAHTAAAAAAGSPAAVAAASWDRLQQPLREPVLNGTAAAEEQGVAWSGRSELSQGTVGGCIHRGASTGARPRVTRKPIGAGTNVHIGDGSLERGSRCTQWLTVSVARRVPHKSTTAQPWLSAPSQRRMEWGGGLTCAAAPRPLGAPFLEAWKGAS
jgi:hypothetical protein